MKHSSSSSSYSGGKNNNPSSQQRTTPKIVFILALTFIILTILSLYSPFIFQHNKAQHPHAPSSKNSSPFPSSSPSSQGKLAKEESSTGATASPTCDIFTGEWIPNPRGPYYTNKTCWAIHEHQNCIKYGRPDTEFMKWRWKPDECELPIFNPAQFLEIVRGKSMAFVGDSVARNQMQSMICLISRLEYPMDVSYTKDERFKRWKYTTYNFTLASFWTPHLVKSMETDSNGPTHTGLFSLHLDQPDDNWTSQIAEFDYVIVSAGHWFFRPLVFHEKGNIVGCHYCLLPNVTDVTMFYGYRKALRTAFKAINGLKNYKGITYLRTYAPSHFENGIWNQGGNCVRTKPFRSNETSLEGANLETYMIQVEEFRRAEAQGRRNGLKYRLLDTSQAMLLRPDGHPSRYGHWAHENVTLYNDCVHWCLPGPIDAWSDFLLEMLKMEGRRSRQEKKKKQNEQLIFSDRRLSVK